MPAFAMRFPRVHCRKANPSADILNSRYWFQMIRIHASSMSARNAPLAIFAGVASMVNFEAIRYGSNVQFIAEPMGLYLLPFIKGASVAIISNLAHPNPTRVTFDNLIPKPFLDGFCRPAEQRAVPLTAMARGVVRGAFNALFDHGHLLSDILNGEWGSRSGNPTFSVGNYSAPIPI